jgi:hypothetical protein
VVRVFARNCACVKTDPGGKVGTSVRVCILGATVLFGASVPLRAPCGARVLLPFPTGLGAEEAEAGVIVDDVGASVPFPGPPELGASEELAPVAVVGPNVDDVGDTVLFLWCLVPFVGARVADVGAIVDEGDLVPVELMGVGLSELPVGARVAFDDGARDVFVGR